jgi:FlaA1/EpsC-like NDP-sugar epimerase
MLKRVVDYKEIWKFATEVIIWSSLTVIAYLLRLDGNIGGHEVVIAQVTMILFIVKSFSVYWFGTFRQSWRNTGFRDLYSIFKSVTLVFLLFLGMVLLFRGILPVPLSVPFIEFTLSLLVLGGLRVVNRFYFVYWNPSRDKIKSKYRVLIVGAGESGNMAAREMFRHSNAGMKPVVFLDDDKSKHGQKFHGIPVAGTINDMQKAVKFYKIDEILIAMPSETGEVIRRVVDEARKTGVKYRTIPSIYDLISGKVSINQIRNVDVEDLLRRKPVQLETGLIHEYIKGQNVLVTGAGGSIGSEIVRQLSRFNPAKIILLGRGENSIHQLLGEIEVKFSHLNYCVRIGNIRDYNTMEKIFSMEKPNVVFHAAAHKHVPLMEANPEQAVLNNVQGTHNLVKLALKHQTKYFVNISTDKAVNPTSVMGATKRISEQIVKWGSEQVKKDEVFVSVRFGNVLGSRGSVIPKFKQQIKRGGPISVTHPEMVRYFMTIPEASQLVLQAGALNMNGSVFVLDMGEPVNIENMARDLIRLSGLKPDKDIKIKYTGVRPGEKLYEELLTAEEGTLMTRHEKIYVAKSADPVDNLNARLENLFQAVSHGSEEYVKSAIKSLVPTYQLSEKEAVNF